ncbi:MAG: L-threonylcarbamoyladenylate synthase [Clostridiales bacterium]
METKLIKINHNNIDKIKLKPAIDSLLNNNVVAFPTETVYGLGAVFSNEKATKKIYQIKGRPSDNPLIVHISSMEQLYDIAFTNTYSDILCEKFWPGPLTLILKKKSSISDIVSAKLPTVAVRMPSNKIALELINQCGPLVAPSANTSGRPSTTQASHVFDDLNNLVDIIIDGGISSLGIESTILDTTSEFPIILRPGNITLEEIKKIIPKALYNKDISKENKAIAPGMKYKHYSPKADVVLVDGDIDFMISKIKYLYSEKRMLNKKIGIMATDETIKFYTLENVVSMGSRKNKTQIAANLFDLLRKFDKIEVDLILIESIELKGLGYSIMNRITKSAGYNVIKE